VPVRVLIPIGVLACPLPVMRICTFWYQHICFLDKYFDFGSNFLENGFTIPIIEIAGVQAAM
jgi:hypothetical protein